MDIIEDLMIQAFQMSASRVQEPSSHYSRREQKYGYLPSKNFKVSSSEYSEDDKNEIYSALKNIILLRIKPRSLINKRMEKKYDYRTGYSAIDGSLVDGFFDPGTEEIEYFARKICPGKNGAYYAGKFNSDTFTMGLKSDRNFKDFEFGNFLNGKL